jgi:hypothetical protein
VLLVAASHDAAVLGRFRDDASVRDLTEFAAELVLLGLSSEVHRVDGEVLTPPSTEETTEVAVLELKGSWQGWYMHHPTATVAEIDEAALLRLASSGASGVITDSITTLDDPEPRHEPPT